LIWFVNLPEAREPIKSFPRRDLSAPWLGRKKERDRIEKELDLRAQASNVASQRASIEASQKRLAQITSNYHSELQNERIATESQYQKIREEWSKINHKRNCSNYRFPRWCRVAEDAPGGA
jgi:HlyD family secretion protein